jgi:hypothetical protein
MPTDSLANRCSKVSVVSCAGRPFYGAETKARIKMILVLVYLLR